MATFWIHKTSIAFAGCCRNSNCFSKRRVKKIIFKCSALLLDNQPTLHLDFGEPVPVSVETEVLSCSCHKTVQSCRPQLWQLTKHYKWGFLYWRHQHGEHRSSRNFFLSWVCSIASMCNSYSSVHKQSSCNIVFLGVENATVAQLTTPRANYTGALAESFCGPRATPAKCIYLQWSRETGKCHYHHLQEAKGSCTEIQSLLHSAKQGSCRRLSKIHD